jgi:hypothetical protein
MIEGETQVSGGEFATEAIKVVIGAVCALGFGWTLALVRKPSREELAQIELRVKTMEAELRAHTTAAAEMRTLMQSIKDSLQQLRHDIRELRGERSRDTDP